MNVPMKSVQSTTEPGPAATALGNPRPVAATAKPLMKIEKSEKVKKTVDIEQKTKHELDAEKAKLQSMEDKIEKENQEKEKASQ